MNIKDILLSSTNDQIVSINTVCQLGSAWLKEDVDLDISFLETHEAGLSFFNNHQSFFFFGGGNDFRCSRVGEEGRKEHLLAFFPHPFGTSFL